MSENFIYEGVTIRSFGETPAWANPERLCRAAAQRRSGLADARNEREADGSVSEYGDGATELMTPRTQPATEELTASRFGSQSRQKGAE